MHAHGRMTLFSSMYMVSLLSLLLNMLIDERFILYYNNDIGMAFLLYKALDVYGWQMLYYYNNNGLLLLYYHS